MGQFLNALMLSGSLIAGEITQEQAKQLLQDKKYTELKSNIDEDSHHELYSYKVNAYLKGEKFEEALALLEERLSHQLNNKEWQAYNYVMKGQVHANQAMDASIFTASGYAEDSLNL